MTRVVEAKEHETNIRKRAGFTDIDLQKLYLKA